MRVPGISANPSFPTETVDVGALLARSSEAIDGLCVMSRASAGSCWRLDGLPSVADVCLPKQRGSRGFAVPTGNIPQKNLCHVSPSCLPPFTVLQTCPLKPPVLSLVLATPAFVNPLLAAQDVLLTPIGAVLHLDLRMVSKSSSRLVLPSFCH